MPSARSVSRSPARPAPACSAPGRRLLAPLAATALLAACPYGAALRSVRLPSGAELSVDVVSSPTSGHRHPVQVSGESVRAALLADGNLLDSEIRTVAAAIAAELGRLTPGERLRIKRSGLTLLVFATEQDLVCSRVDSGTELKRSTHQLQASGPQVPRASTPIAPATAVVPVAPDPGGTATTLTPPVPAGKGPIVAAFDMEDPTRRVDAAVLAQLTTYLTAKLTAEGFRIVPRAQLRAQLAQQKRESYRQCFDEACQIELGKAVAAQKSLATRLLKVGQSCAISSTLYDLKTETTERAASVRTDCSDGALLEGLDRLVRQLAPPR